jgi:hypothetical protein
LAERLSPKQEVVGSIPAWPAKKQSDVKNRASFITLNWRKKCLKKRKDTLVA